MLKRAEALQLVTEAVSSRNLVKHMLAVEAVMRALAGRLGEDPDRWGVTGLVHDVDYERTESDPDAHSLVGGDLLAGLGFEAEIVQAVKAHNERHGLPRATLLAKGLFAADPVTGLIVAAALVHPAKRLAPLDVAFIMHRFGEKSFARGANREQLKTCSELGLSLEEFVGLSLEAMQGISRELEL